MDTETLEVETLTPEIKAKVKAQYLEELKKEELAGQRPEVLTPNQIAEMEASNAAMQACKIDLGLPCVKYHAPKDALRYLYCVVMLYGSELKAEDINCKSFEVKA